MAEEHEGGGDHYSGAIITFRPDNFLTVGLMFVVVYLAGALIAQGLMRAGILSSATAAPKAVNAQPAPGTVAAA
jgi:hypothetical protein